MEEQGRDMMLVEDRWELLDPDIGMQAEEEGWSGLVDCRGNQEVAHLVFKDSSTSLEMVV